MPTMFINIGWMNYYNGPDPNDPTRGNFRYLNNHRHGFECYIFEPFGQYAYGAPPTACIPNLEQLGATRRSHHVNNVLVIWMAKNPINKKTYIVGWYNNATVFSSWQTKETLSQKRQLNNHHFHYTIQCKKRDIHLVDTYDRVFTIPATRGGERGFGQSPFWYAQNRPDILKEAIKYVENNTIPLRLVNNHAPGHLHNQFLRKEIETTAVDCAINHYERLGFNVKSVEIESKGWDLEASNNDETILIEVKGTSSKIIGAEFTPNEYKMLSSRSNEYVIFIVTDCLETPSIHIFLYYKDDRLWLDKDGNILAMKEKTGAIAYIKQ